MIALHELTERQREVYESDAKRLLVLGGPGTGKTLVALLTARRVAEEDKNGKRVLFVTFSRAATTELLSRVPATVSGELGSRIEVATFHGLAVSVLDAFRRFVGGPIGPVVIATREEVQLDVAPDGSIEFDALIPSAVALLGAAPWVLALYRSRYAAVICDEFQDTRDDQLAFLELLAEDGRLICLADPNQMIFDGLPGAASIARRIEQFRATGPSEIDLADVSHRDPSQVIPRAAAGLRDRQFDADDVVMAVRDERLFAVTSGDVRASAIEEIQAALARGASTIGVFFATNRQVNEFADRLRDRGLDHEIGGLSHASGEAELTAALMTRHAAGDASWDDVLRRLGIFQASTTRGTPQLIARQLVRGEAGMEDGLRRVLRRQRDMLLQPAVADVGEFLGRARTFWRGAFRGGGQRLWEIGLDDLLAQTIELRERPLDSQAADAVAATAERRRAAAALDSIPSIPAPIQVMNLYQVKGRQMDVSIVVREPSDREPMSQAEARRLGRLVYVAVSRARSQAGFVLPSSVAGYFGPYAGLQR